MTDKAALKSAADKLSAARAWLILHQPFFGCLALRLQLVPNEFERTAAVDGKRIFYNPAFINAQIDATVRTIVAHEVMHCALHHIFRRGNRDPIRWNLACDHATNAILKDAGFDVSAGICDPKFKGMTAEAIYPLIPEQPAMSITIAILGPAGPGKEGADFGGTGRAMDAAPSDPDDPAPAASSADMEAQLREWDIAVVQAANTVKGQGKLPAGLEWIVEAAERPQINWRERLRHFLQNRAHDDYSWRVPNRRFLGAGDYLPSLYSEHLGPIVWIRDTSGSVAQPEHEAVAAELTACAEDTNPESIDVICIDTKVHRVDHFTADDYPLRAVPVRGGGGTHLAPAWQYLRDHDIDPVCAILTTDMELSAADLGDEPPFPCLILSTGREQPYDGPVPFGEVVMLELGR